MNINVTVQEIDQEYFIGNIALVNDIKLKLEDFKAIPIYLKGIGGGSWLDTATNQAANEMDNCTKKLIREAEAELIKAKQYMKDSYPIRYKMSYAKVILKNPFKTLIAKCLLKLK